MWEAHFSFGWWWKYVFFMLLPQLAFVETKLSPSIKMANPYSPKTRKNKPSLGSLPTYSGSLSLLLRIIIPTPYIKLMWQSLGTQTRYSRIGNFLMLSSPWNQMLALSWTVMVLAKFWPMIKGSNFPYFQRVHCSNMDPSCLSHIVIILLPKHNDADSLTTFMPISL